MACDDMLCNFSQQDCGDEGEEAYSTNDFEKSEEHVRIPKQDIEHVLNFLEMHEIF